MPKNKDIRRVFEYWNSCHIIVHKRLDKVMTNVITSVLKDYPVEEIEEAIKLYEQVLKSEDHFFSYKWRIEEFLKRGLRNFLAESEPLTRYLKAGKSFDTEGITPPVPSVSPAYRKEFLEKKRKMLDDTDQCVQSEGREDSLGGTPNDRSD